MIGLTALTPPAKPAGGWVTSLEALRLVSGRYADAMIADEEWSALAVWLTNVREEPVLRNDHTAAILATNIVRAADMARLNHPNVCEPWFTGPLIDVLEPEAQADAYRIAEETREDWRATGRTVTADQIASAHKFVPAAIGRNARKVAA